MAHQLTVDDALAEAAKCFLKSKQPKQFGETPQNETAAAWLVQRAARMKEGDTVSRSAGFCLSVAAYRAREFAYWRRKSVRDCHTPLSPVFGVHYQGIGAVELSPGPTPLDTKQQKTYIDLIDDPGRQADDGDARAEMNQGTKGPIGMKANSAVMLNVEQSRVCDEEEAAVMGAQAGQCGRRAQPASLARWGWECGGKPFERSVGDNLK
ncbi:hypothetical protein BJV77DRAFT_1148474 [Russula vinacea]|nr:hypothetical protein BJV77DRAFT_1148474 [Russula vinacea]